MSADDNGFIVDRRALLTAGAALTAASVLGLTRPASAKDPKDYQFALSVPFEGLQSYEHIINGYKDAVAKFGGHLTIASCNYDVKKQSDQIATFVASKVDALFILPADPAGVSKAVQAAVASGVPVFLVDSYVPGVTVTSMSIENSFGMGLLTGEYLCKRLGGKGKIATITLPENETWAMRAMALDTVLVRYPDVKVVANWAFDPTMKVTSRDAADQFLTAHPDLDAIWTAWDDAAINCALAIKAAGRDKVFVTGMDGGKQAFQYIKSGSPFVFTAAQAFYQESFYNVYYAHQHLAGQAAPRIITNVAWGVSKDELKDDLDKYDSYDRFGVAEQLGWRPL
ncbi:MAG: sugar ABC transporter substrate-binding protein [Roseiarcus sp.]